MPVTETCLTCGAPLLWIPDHLHPHQGIYIHLTPAPDWHEPVPALENPAVAIGADPAAGEGI
ncbi:MAG: hypothetical protein M0Z38_08435 [Deltaproteobacteria bacterium]|nr:hypothetical protein [Deltaproteobacteria bacterium]